MNSFKKQSNRVYSFIIYYVECGEENRGGENQSRGIRISSRGLQTVYLTLGSLRVCQSDKMPASGD